MIKKIPICLVILFLFGGTFEKANAVERVVIASLPSELWYDNLFLMADTIDGNWMAVKASCCTTSLIGTT
ncbi:hypothetical protein AA0X95_04085 [Bacillus sp. 1P10SD]|uniref:hypothetical protein n=1 Tax=Bacillus sp. 1P10SD TaxID=3132265 RepID=UPI0039A631AF